MKTLDSPERGVFFTFFLIFKNVYNSDLNADKWMAISIHWNIVFIFTWKKYSETFLIYVAAAAKSLQSCPILCDPIDGRPPGSAIPRILQTRTLEWAAISFSNAWKWKVKVKSLSRVRLLATPWTAAYQAPPSMGFFQARVLEWVAIAFSILIYTCI